MTKFKKTALVLLAALLCFTAGCGKNEPSETQNTADTDPVLETSASGDVDETDVNSETEAKDTEKAESNTETDETEEKSDAETSDPADESEEADETEDPEAAETGETRIYDYLNGKTVIAEEQVRRPIAVMMNNIKDCLPQNSLTKGDLFYEFPVEGGITRIMMLVSDYADLDVVGSVRSSRDYFVDMLHTHNAIYIHAGGSNMAYEKILGRNINKLDAVTMYIPDMFYRDQYRLQYMASEHTLMTTGEGIVGGIKYQGYATEHDESFKPSYRFYDEDTDNKLDGESATHIHMNSTFLQTVDFVYSEDTGEYVRYQYNGMPHVDGLTDEQLSVKNVVILFTDVALIPGDDAGRLSIVTEGSGKGYYITNGSRVEIEWKRADATAPLELDYPDGEDVIFNCGKTFICVVDKTVESTLVFDYQW